MRITNVFCRVRIGRSLVSTHEYHRAVDFYEQAIKQALQEGTRASGSGAGNSSEAVALSHDLAKLFLKLDRGESSARVLTRVLHENHRDITDRKQNVTTLLMLSEVYKKINPSEVPNTLKRAFDLQREVLSQVWA